MPPGGYHCQKHQLIASTAAANGLAVYTRNPSDFEALKSIVKVVPV